MQTTTTAEQPRERRLHVVPEPKARDSWSPGKQALMTALREHPGGETSSVLADQAKIGKSTARRLLGELVEQGVVMRTPGSGGGPGRIPDRFSSADDLTEDAPAPAGPSPLTGVSSTGTVATTMPGAGARDDAAEGAGEGAAVDAANTPPTPDHEVVEPPIAAERDTHGLASAVGEVGRAPTVASAAEPVAGPGVPSRLGPNELRGKVEQYLIEHPDREFGPHALSQLLGHSSGAITNVLIRLVRASLARQTQIQPRRFAASPNPKN